MVENPRFIVGISTLIVIVPDIYRVVQKSDTPVLILR